MNRFYKKSLISLYFRKGKISPISYFSGNHPKRVLYTMSGQTTGKKDHHYSWQGQIIAVVSFNQMTEHQMLSSSLEGEQIKEQLTQLRSSTSTKVNGPKDHHCLVG